MPAAIPLIIAGVSAAGSAASAASKKRAEGRAAEAGHLQTQDKAALDRALSDRNAQFNLADLDLNRRKFSSTERDANIDRAKRGGALEGVQDIEFEGIPAHIASRMPKIKGGLRPSAIVGREQLGRDVRAKALDAMLKGEQYDPVKLGELPGVSEPPKPTGFDKFLNIAGTIGGAAGIANQAMGARSPKVAPVGIDPKLVKPGKMPDFLTGNPMYNR